MVLNQRLLLPVPLAVCLFGGPVPAAGGLVLRVPRRAHALALQMLFVPAFHRRELWRPRGGGAGAGRPRAHK